MGHGTKSCASRKGLGFAGSHLALEVEGEDHEANGKVRTVRRGNETMMH